MQTTQISESSFYQKRPVRFLPNDPHCYDFFYKTTGKQSLVQELSDASFRAELISFSRIIICPSYLDILIQIVLKTILKAIFIANHVFFNHLAVKKVIEMTHYQKFYKNKTERRENQL